MVDICILQNSNTNVEGAVLKVMVTAMKFESMKLVVLKVIMNLMLIVEVMMLVEEVMRNDDAGRRGDSIEILLMDDRSISSSMFELFYPDAVVSIVICCEEQGVLCIYCKSFEITPYSVSCF